jgi:surface antigen
MMAALRLALAGLAALAVVGCAQVEQAPKQTAGTVVGAGLGALAGSQIGSGDTQLGATAVGTLLGAWLGSEVGRSLDRADRLYAQQATYNALEYRPTGTATTWRNPDSGHYGTVTPTRTFQTAGQDCREYQHTVTIEGRPETMTGTACRQPDGSWRAV